MVPSKKSSTRPLLRIASLGRRRYSRHKKKINGSGGRWISRTSCGSIVLAVVLGAMITIPYVLIGPRVVLSVSISPRDQSKNGARLEERGLRGHKTDDNVTEASKETTTSQVEDVSRPASLASVGQNTSGRSSERQIGQEGGPDVRDLCVCMAVGISPAQLVTFAASFRDVAPTADLVMFFEAPTSQRFDDIVHKFRITPLQFDRERLEPSFLRRYDASAARWIMIQRFLDLKGSSYERVLIAEAGQTFFQSNPFDIIGDPGVYTFMDDQLIGDSEQRSTKIRDCLGAPVLAKLVARRAVHSGVILGTSSFAVDYASKMSQGLVSAAFQQCAHEATDVDTSLSNFLLYGGGVPGVLTFEQGSGPLADVQGGKYKISGSCVVNSCVVNLSGREVPIVFRYVVNASLRADVFQRYIYWAQQDEDIRALPGEKAAVNVNGASSVTSHIAVATESKVEPAYAPNTVANCERYSLSQGLELFKAKCDLAERRADSLGACCAECSSLQACQAFSFAEDNGMCFLKDCSEANAPGPSTVAPSITTGIKSQQTAY